MRKGLHVVAGKRRLGRRFFKLTSRRLSLHNLPAGTHVVKISLAHGALKPRASLRRRAARGKHFALELGLQAVDAVGGKTNFSVTTRAKS